MMRWLLLIFAAIIITWLVAAVFEGRQCVAQRSTPYTTRYGVRSSRAVCVMWEIREAR